MHGYKAHVATDEAAGLVRGVEVTTANVHDAAELAAILPPEPGDAYGDSAFTGGPAERLIIGRGGRPRTVWTGIWGRGPEARWRAWRRIALPCGESAAGSRRYLAPEAVLWLAPDALARLGPRRACRSGSPPWPSTCGARSPCCTPRRLMRDEFARLAYSTPQRGKIGTRDVFSGFRSPEERHRQPQSCIRAHVSSHGGGRRRLDRVGMSLGDLAFLAVRSAEGV